MSIYALPGPLFKLVSNGMSTPKSKEVVEVAPKTSKDSYTEGQSSSLSVSDCIENPLHRKPSSGSLDTSDHLTTSTSSQSRHNSNGDVVIAVKEAKIDSARLIRSLALSGDSKKKKKNAAAKPKPLGEDNRQDDGSDNGRKCDPHEEAINFEFSVSFNGREYSATRTLPRILQFRTDLIEEFRARRMWRERRRKRKQSVPPPMAKVRDLSDDEEEEDGSIPELPRLSEDAAGSRGFTMLNALLRSYGPALEHWMMKVMDIVPHDSQCLTQFLWEPVSGNAANSKKFERRRSSSTLLAIQEKDSEDSMEDLEQYDSDTDDYLLIH